MLMTISYVDRYWSVFVPEVSHHSFWHRNEEDFSDEIRVRHRYYKMCLRTVCACESGHIRAVAGAVDELVRHKAHEIFPDEIARLVPEWLNILTLFPNCLAHFLSTPLRPDDLNMSIGEHDETMLQMVIQRHGTVDPVLWELVADE